MAVRRYGGTAVRRYGGTRTAMLHTAGKGREWEGTAGRKGGDAWFRPTFHPQFQPSSLLRHQTE